MGGVEVEQLVRLLEEQGIQLAEAKVLEVGLTQCSGS